MPDNFRTDDAKTWINRDVALQKDVESTEDGAREQRESLFTNYKKAHTMHKNIKSYVLAGHEETQHIEEYETTPPCWETK